MPDVFQVKNLVLYVSVILTLKQSEGEGYRQRGKEHLPEILQSLRSFRMTL
jgi:hypothetical protein